MSRDRHNDYNWQIPLKWLKDKSREILLPEINRSLLFDKYLSRPFDEQGNIKFKEGNKTIPITDKNLSAVLDLRCPISKDEYNFLKERKNSATGAVKFCLKTKTRLLINHGGESILESNIALHPLYGFPIIYGSAIKGVTRHYCGPEYANKEKSVITKIFGSESAPEQGGLIAFGDAWPKTHQDLDCLKLDVITPHYKPYYDEQKEFPADNLQPSPHQFLAVKEGVCFEFVIYPAMNSNINSQEMQDLLKSTKDYIKQALTKIGIGAKTTSSYGYFEE